MDLPIPQPRDLGQEAYGRIRAAIRDGTLGPGLRLTETDLAARFGVSRTPVRQAIARLEAEGLLTHEPRRGLTVMRPDHQQVVELYVMREVLEAAAARLAAQHASPTEIGAMAELVAGEPAHSAMAGRWPRPTSGCTACCISPRITATCCAAWNSSPRPWRCCRAC